MVCTNYMLGEGKNPYKSEDPGLKHKRKGEGKWKIILTNPASCLKSAMNCVYR